MYKIHLIALNVTSAKIKNQKIEDLKLLIISHFYNKFYSIYKIHHFIFQQ